MGRLALAMPVLVLVWTAADIPVPKFELPAACEPGKTCWVVNYFDHEPGSAARDYVCEALTYDGHGGTDFAIRDLVALAAGVPIVAAAAGMVQAIRNGTGLSASASPAKCRRERVCDHRDRVYRAGGG